MKESEIIKALRSESEEFIKFENEHRELDLILDELQKKKHLTTEEEVDKKTMQKQKLHYKDQMAQIISQYKVK
ncbi:MAG: DUF465 domain-containing protein [Thermodesulfovibrionia bacterium]|nr:DUF465 domain-containing protein [Thermodesulfovibrionia bacterium]